MKVFIGIELGSTRIKAAIVNEHGEQLASGGFDWENRFESDIWTYRLEDVWTGLQESFRALSHDYLQTHKHPLPQPDGIGISAMMHGYLVFDENFNLLTPFRTWRNTNTGGAAKILSGLFEYNIQLRWSIAHLYHAIRGNEAHVRDIRNLTTLAGYVHNKLTGKNVVGIGEASGIFPIDCDINDYCRKRVSAFDNLIAEHNLPWTLSEILPKVLKAGDDAGALTEEGARLLDPSGNLKPGASFCPPEGDAGTGMVATNSVIPGRGNISAGTSIFAMIVLEKELTNCYPEIAIVATPTGKPVAMTHANNCTSDLDAWIDLIGQIMSKMGETPDKTLLYKNLYNSALCGDADGGGLVSINYLSGEHTTKFTHGRPLFIRTPDSTFSVDNFFRVLLYSAMATIRIGLDILAHGEGVRPSGLLGHGGLFKTKIVGQKLMAGAYNTPISVMDSAGEGGAWGIALLAAYRVCKEDDESLEAFLANKIFADANVSVIDPDPEDVTGFNAYMKVYMAALEVERAAVESIMMRGQKNV